MDREYEDNYWAEDAIFMERNSRDFVSRIERINKNAEAICQTLAASPVGRCSIYSLKAWLIPRHSQKGVLSQV